MSGGFVLPSGSGAGSGDLPDNVAVLDGANDFDQTPTVAGSPVVVLVAGKIDPTELPALAITETFPVASQVAMLALTAQQGDVAIRSDLNKTFILSVSPASTLGNWLELKTPTDAVTSVNGLTGVVTISGSSLTVNASSKTSSYTVTDDDGVINATTSSIVITLHDATTARVKRYTVRNGSAGNISFATTSSQTVNGSTTGTLVPQQSIDVVPLGGNWIIV
jgi:hypothetical protein